MKGVALVTGAAGAIGRAIARQLHEVGWQLILVDNNEEPLRSVCEALQPARSIVTDLSKPQSVHALVAAVAECGRLDALINNAAILGPVGPAQEIETEEWDHVLAVNLRAAWLCAKALHQALAASRGRIVNVSSMAGERGSAGLAAYAASKAGLLGLTRTLAAEWAPHGIAVNAVLPGIVEGGVSEQLPADVRARLIETSPLKRGARPDEIATVVCFLASANAEHLSGASIAVAGAR
jgi:NAD(P)-dependent dehydrogenase (short-subunit alcohol dehydrogenase family)